MQEHRQKFHTMLNQHIVLHSRALVHTDIPGQWSILLSQVVVIGEIRCDSIYSPVICGHYCKCPEEKEQEDFVERS